ncbi:MAG: cadmium-translocating P-type ATPase [Rhizobiales bacterium]|nr:cadmium-translocating P-type ATPase [Hyphomicrobiales bacterium]
MTERLRFKVEGMDCASCAQVIERGVGRVAGVSEVAISTTTETLAFAAADAGVAPAVERVVRELGYQPRRIGTADVPADADAGHAGHDHGDHGHANHGHDDGEDDHDAPIDGPWWRSGRGQLVVASGALVGIAFAAAHFFPAAAYWIYLAACLIAGAPVVLHAFRALRHGSLFTIEMLMTIAVAGAIAIGAAEEAAVVVFLFAVGELLEGVAAGRARAGIKALAAIAPTTARLETAGGVVEVPVASVPIGAVVVVRPGDRVPADGTVLSGASSVDESALTGESMPRPRKEGETVLAGSINQEGTLRVRVEKPATDTLIARVVKLVDEAAETKAPSERFVDRFARSYMPAICLAALAVAILPPLVAGEPWETWIYRGLTLLLIGCPCALVISTPAAIASALAAGARHGLLVKGGAAMEAIGRVRHIAFDKTGTLTEGRPRVTDVRALAAAGEAEVLSLAAAIGADSSHPLSVAIVAAAQERGVTVPQGEGSEALAGRGIRGMVAGRSVVVGAAARLGLDAATVAQSQALEAEGKSVSAVVVDGAPIGLIALRDEPRPDARAALAELRALGVVAVMLTGDNRANGEAIGRDLGIAARTELMPEDKLAIVRALAGDGGVAQVGDGINDAPALAAATVGIAMGSGTDVALEAGDAAILRNRIGDVPGLVRLSRRTMEVVRQNIGLALGLKAVFLVTTILGVTGLWIAVLADTGATVLVTGNALRLLGWRAERG